MRIRRNTIIGCSHAARRVLEQIEQVAATNATVLLLGETGTGKELYASHLHQRSSRGNREMVRVNCAAVPSTLIESELFGRERGAYTDAVSRQIGRFELAMIVATGPDLTIPLPAAKASAVVGNTLLDVEKAHIRTVLESTGWRIRGVRGAANRLGLPPTTLESRMAKLGLTRPKSIVTN
jgi:transcriptional regulator with GAF, ATPase, and Fis domain